MSKPIFVHCPACGEGFTLPVYDLHPECPYCRQFFTNREVALMARLYTVEVALEEAFEYEMDAAMKDDPETMHARGCSAWPTGDESECDCWIPNAHKVLNAEEAQP